MWPYIETSVLIANLNKNKQCTITNKQRENEIKNFFEYVLSPEPDLIILQDAYVRVDSSIDQIDTVMKALSGDWAFFKKVEFETGSYQKCNAILNNRSTVKFEPEDFSFHSDIDESRFEVSKFFAAGEESILVVSFHGQLKMKTAERERQLKTLLRALKTMKRQTGSGHLIIGGYFNVNLGMDDAIKYFTLVAFMTICKIT
jgi:endonuclease/exonuclease/phosphatase family metal-dependent hydrolase